MPKQQKDKGSLEFGPVLADSVKDALSHILGSENFTASPRLQQFLSYVVEEALAGRGAQIKGKTIAADVYGRELDDDGGGQNLVSVEARRLRRLLEAYYAAEGRHAALRISIDPGGYTPRFSLAQAPDSPTSPANLSIVQHRKRGIVAAAIAAGLAILALFVAVLWQPKDTTPLERSDAAAREALRDRSATSLQAVNLATQARGMFFPVFDLRRQEIALNMFRHSIELDPGLPGGYAGAGQVLAVLSLLSQESVEAVKLQEEASKMTEKAIDLAPTDGWGQASRALSLAVSGENEDAMRFARRALELAPNDGHVLDLIGSTAILLQDGQLAADVSHPERERSGVGRFGAWNIWGVSQLMLGDNQTAVDTFAKAPTEGAPVSPPSLLFLAVAYERLGEHDRANDLISELFDTWPDFPATFIVGRLFGEGTIVKSDILNTLEKYRPSSDVNGRPD